MGRKCVGPHHLQAREDVEEEELIRQGADGVVGGHRSIGIG
jgi:hypothetical protein